MNCIPPPLAVEGLSIHNTVEQAFVGRYGYSHYKNYGEPGDCVFVTATCLDFVHIFSRPMLADLMSASLLWDCRRFNAPLSAFVVMPHHLHALVNVPEGMTAPSLIGAIKSLAARRIFPHLDEKLLGELSIQTGLNSRTFWKRSFRGYIVNTNTVADQKMRYVHWNPVKAGLANEPEEYRWSSLRFRLAMQVTEDGALAISDEMIESFVPLHHLLL